MLSILSTLLIEETLHIEEILQINERLSSLTAFRLTLPAGEIPQGSRSLRLQGFSADARNPGW